MKKLMTIKMSDGSVCGVPVEMIALDRAKNYADEFDNNIERSLAEDTLPLFEENNYAIEDWAVGNMDWSDFEGHYVKVSDAPLPDFKREWVNGEKGYIDI